VDTAIYIGGANPDSSDSLAKGIVQIMESGRKNGFDNKTVQMAIGVFGKGVKAPSNMNISDCRFDGGPRYNIDPEKD